jgi:hypothetical protein
MSNDWKECVDKVAMAVFERIGEIKKDIPVDTIRENAIESLSKIVPSGMGFPLMTPDGEVDIDMTSLVDVVDRINCLHREQISEFLATLGEFVVIHELSESTLKSNPNPDSRFAGEDLDSVYLRYNGSTLKIDKEYALKIATLGYIP